VSELFEEKDLNVDAPWLGPCRRHLFTLTRDGTARLHRQPSRARWRGMDSQNAVGAAFRDPRFPSPGADDGRAAVGSLSVVGCPSAWSSPMKTTCWRSSSPASTGVILELDGRRATFLPQVWESLPDKALRFSANW